MPLTPSNRQNLPQHLLFLLTLILTLSIGAGLLALPARAQTNQPAYLGIRTIDSDRGTEIVEVISGSPADVAGFLVGDVILGVNNQALSKTFTLDDALNKLKPGDKAQFTVYRTAGTVQIIVTMGTRPDVVPTSNPAASPGQGGTAAANAPASNPTAVPALTFMGVGLSEESTGLRVIGVLRNGPADQGGIRIGDLLLMFDSQKLSTVAQAEAIVQAKKAGDSLAVHAMRGDQALDLSVKLIARPDSIIGTPIVVLTASDTPAAGTAAPTADPDEYTARTERFQQCPSWPANSAWRDVSDRDAADRRQK
jgi:S1-C subfamily serine protease